MIQHIRRRLLPLLSAPILVSGIATSLGAQGVLIAPSVVVVDARTRSAALTLVNSGTESVEATLSTQFGFPATDSTGGMYLRTFESVPDTMPSAATWIRAFPERLILAPGERRTVRVLVTPPPKLASGEYWSRLVVATRTVATRRAAEGNEVKIGLDLEVRSVLPLFYRNGAVSTGVEIASPVTTLSDDSLFLRIPMRRRGNAAFVGSVRATVRDDRGTIVTKDSLPLGVYYDLMPRMALGRHGIGAGNYTVSVEAIAARPDVGPGILLPITPVRAQAALRVPSGK